MTQRSRKDVGASVRERLLNRSQDSGEDFQFLLQRYAAERLLYRLGQSDHRREYVLKGAMLFPLWGGSAYRPTRDLDFTGYGSAEVDDVVRVFRHLCTFEGVDDGVIFHSDTITSAPIRDESEYHGLRLKFRATVGGARVPMQIDIGFGNAIEPGAEDVEYPALLDAPAPRIRAYPRQAVVAEKLHAMVILGERNSRLKDFYDLFVLCSQFEFRGESLTAAIAATFTRRRTPIATSSPAALTSRFYADEARSVRWRAYVLSRELPGVTTDFSDIGERLMSFLLPPWTALVSDETFADEWPPCGPWRIPGTQET